MANGVNKSGLSIEPYTGDILAIPTPRTFTAV